MAEENSYLHSSTLPAFALLGPTATQIGSPREAVEWVDHLLNWETEANDARVDFNVIVYAADIYQLLDTIGQNIILAVADQNVKSQLWQAFTEERAANGSLTLSEEKIDAIEDQIVQTDGQDSVGIQELEIVNEELGVVDQAAEDLQTAIANSRHKVFYDYIATLKTAEGKLLVEDYELLKSELEKVRRLEEKATVTLDRKLSDLPVVKEGLEKARLIPSGIVKSLSPTMDGYQIMLILQGADRVAMYFLNKLKTQRGEPVEKFVPFYGPRKGIMPVTEEIPEAGQEPPQNPNAAGNLPEANTNVTNQAAGEETNINENTPPQGQNNVSPQ